MSTEPQLSIAHQFSELESIKFQLRLIIPKLTDRLAAMLAYMFLYPDEYKDKLIIDDVCASKASITARSSYLNEIGILKKVLDLTKTFPEQSKRKYYNYILNPSISSSLTKTNFSYNIKIEVV